MANDTKDLAPVAQTMDRAIHRLHDWARLLVVRLSQLGRHKKKSYQLTLCTGMQMEADRRKNPNKFPGDQII